MSFDTKSPPRFIAAFNTSKGTFVVEAVREWAPRGVDRFYSLIRAGYYDDSRFYRVIDGWVAQFGVSGDVSEAQSLRHNIILDDPIMPKVHNDEAFLSFSAVYNTAADRVTNRTTELFINLENHRDLDALGFTPIAKVKRGFGEVASALFSGYGEMSDTCALHGFEPCEGPTEADMYQHGNEFVDQQFPLLDRLYDVRVIKEFDEPLASGDSLVVALVVFAVLLCGGCFLFVLSAPPSQFEPLKAKYRSLIGEAAPAVTAGSTESRPAEEGPVRNPLGEEEALSPEGTEGAFEFEMAPQTANP